MMKVMKLFLALLISYSVQSQTTTYYSPVTNPIKWARGGFDSLFMPEHDTIRPIDTTKGWVTWKDSVLYKWQTNKWKAVSGQTSIDLSGYIQKETQNPTASLNPSGHSEDMMAAGADISTSLTWTAGRQAATSTTLATANLSTITVNGVSQTFSNPAAGSTVSGTQSVTYPRNVSTSFPMVVTTSDGKTVTVTSVYNFSFIKYWFASSTQTPSNSEIINVSGGGLNLLYPETKVIDNIVITASGGNKYLNYAYPTTLGALTSITINGFENISAFTQTTVSVTSSRGAVQNYYLYTSNNLLPTTTLSAR